MEVVNCERGRHVLGVWQLGVHFVLLEWKGWAVQRPKLHRRGHADQNADGQHNSAAQQADVHERRRCAGAVLSYVLVEAKTVYENARLPWHNPQRDHASLWQSSSQCGAATFQHWRSWGSALDRTSQSQLIHNLSQRKNEKWMAIDKNKERSQNCGWPREVQESSSCEFRQTEWKFRRDVRVTFVPATREKWIFDSNSKGLESVKSNWRGWSSKTDELPENGRCFLSLLLQNQYLCDSLGEYPSDFEAVETINYRHSIWEAQVRL